MPVFSLDYNNLVFPKPQMADSSGLLAIGGRLDIDWLIEAYSLGIFPWYNNDEPIMWWSPDPRSVIYPKDIKISKSMKLLFRNNVFELKIDCAFNDVVDYCQNIVRKNQDGTWITDEMKDAYSNLHKYGLAHSFEAWNNGKLVGGLYGVSLGKMFFGESMFSLQSNASKFAFISLNIILRNNNFSLVDCQIPNTHLNSLGCFDMKRLEFLNLLKNNKTEQNIRGNWGNGLLKTKFDV